MLAVQPDGSVALALLKHEACTTIDRVSSFACLSQGKLLCHFAVEYDLQGFMDDTFLCLVGGFSPPKLPKARRRLRRDDDEHEETGLYTEKYIDLSQSSQSYLSKEGGGR